MGIESIVWHQSVGASRIHQVTSTLAIGRITFWTRFEFGHIVVISIHRMTDLMEECHFTPNHPTEHQERKDVSSVARTGLTHLLRL